MRRTPRARKPGEGTAEEARRRRAGLIRKDFDVRCATVVIDGDMRVLPANASDARPTIAMNPVPDAGDARERFDIEMHEVARMRPFVAAGRGRRGEPRQPIEPRPRQYGRDRRPGHLELDGDGPGGPPLIARGEDAGRQRRARCAAAAAVAWRRGPRGPPVRRSGTAPAICTRFGH